MPELYGALRPFGEKDFEKLHLSTLSLLEKTGVYADNEEVLEYARKAGHKVDMENKTIRFDSAIVEKNIRTASHSLDRREPPENLIFSCDGGTGHVHEYGTNKRRDATERDIADFCRLVDALPNIDEVSLPLYTRDVPYEIMDLTIFRQVWANTAKSGGGGLSRNTGALFNNTPDALEYLRRLARIRYGADQKPDGTPLISSFVGASSPLRFDGTVLESMLCLVRMGQVSGIGSNVIAGVQGPASLAGVVVMENAERLALLSMLMAVDPDAWFYFCNHPNYLDMVMGTTANGSPEHSLMAMCATGLLRHYGFQLMANHPCLTTASNMPGIQPAAEKAVHALLTGLTGASGVSVCGGLFEAMSYEQLVIDNEIAGMVKHLLRGMDVNDDTIHLDVMEDLGIGANFLEHECVAEDARKYYWKPELWNRRSYSDWQKNDGRDIMEKAHEKVCDILENHHPKPLTDMQEAEMDELIKEARAVLLKS